VFWVNVPLGALAFVLAWRWLPADPAPSTSASSRFDLPGTAVLALALASYALAMTLGRGHFGLLNVALLVGAAAGLALFAVVESRASAPLLRLARLRDPVLAAGLAMGAIVSTVMMSTLVIGPFYFSQALGLAPAAVGLAMSVGPCVAALGGVPAGRLVDRIGGRSATLVGLAGIAAGSLAIAVMPASAGLVGYLVPLVVLTAHYALFQAANNTVVMGDVPADQRGVVSGLINLSRNLGLMTGASAMGAVFAFAAATRDPAAGQAAAVDFGMRASFATAFVLVVAALIIGAATRTRRAS
jgi:predicted MFS family arabinose efflux permease